MAGILSRAWYHDRIEDFLLGGPDRVLGRLLSNANRAVEASQRDAWMIQYDLLAEALRGMRGTIFWEFSIPRMGRRIDVLVFHRSALLLIEFKVGAREFHSKDLLQVWDYALDLKNFHETSHHLPIFPILCATEVEGSDLALPPSRADGVFEPMRCGRAGLPPMLRMISDSLRTESTGATSDDWMEGAYRPTPTIVEAARALYSNHSVEDIARSDAGAMNLALTSGRVEQLAERARSERKKIICFVTGVPGAGKTLVGLDVANRKREESDHAVFLSGNGPLVEVLREALTRDEFAQRKEKGESVRKGRIAEGVKSFIQNVHHFRDESLIDVVRPPADRVVIFDEAQRAWNATQTANFMLRKKKRSGFTESEPELLLGYLDRHPDWCLVVCLVGGGQEINTGEAGIDGWLQPLETRFSHWEVYISDRMVDTEYGSAWVHGSAISRANTYFDDSLHLATSMRSFRAENLATLIKSILAVESQTAIEEFTKLRNQYPIFITRSLDQARQWLRRMARGTERYGIVASSKALRLKPHAIDIRATINPVLWFLNDRADIRSSYYLEDAATEFQVQGLELDWTCVAWDADLRYTKGRWEFFDFSGDSWKRVHKEDRQRYLKNAYRVLLTRARQGMVLFIPPGDPEDPTRLPCFYDPIWEYLRSIGLSELVL
ncbi:DUF2075 domain-containing protein [bacterium]|nr:DUF2075 domain-containing protein [bacterium]